MQTHAEQMQAHRAKFTPTILREVIRRAFKLEEASHVQHTYWLFALDCMSDSTLEWLLIKSRHMPDLNMRHAIYDEAEYRDRQDNNRFDYNQAA